MKYKLLGNTGLRVSEVALGTMTFGQDWGWGSTKETSKRMLDYYLDRGGNFIDTANIYTNGQSEEILGQLIKEKRQQIVLSTKFGASTDKNNANANGASRKNLIQSVENSLKRLNTDYIDLYWLHLWDEYTQDEEYLRALDDLVRAGKILYLGISDAPAWIVSRANAIAKSQGLTEFSAIQIEHNLLERTVERELVPMAERLGLSVTVWSPLAAGVLTGKYLKDKTASGRMSKLGDELYQKYQTEKATKIVEEVVEVSKQLNVSEAQVALSWLMTQFKNHIPIIGGTKMEHIEDNLSAIELKLTQEHLNKLNEVSKITLGFPHDFYALRKERTESKHEIIKN